MDLFYLDGKKKKPDEIHYLDLGPAWMRGEIFFTSFRAYCKKSGEVFIPSEREHFLRLALTLRFLKNSKNVRDHYIQIKESFDQVKAYAGKAGDEIYVRISIYPQFPRDKEVSLKSPIEKFSFLVMISPRSPLLVVQKEHVKAVVLTLPYKVFRPYPPLLKPSHYFWQAKDLRHYAPCEVLYALDGNLLQGCSGNLIFYAKERFYAPPANSLMMMGITARSFKKRYPVVTKTISVQDLSKMEEVFLMNAVRGLVSLHEIQMGKEKWTFSQKMGDACRENLTFI